MQEHAATSQIESGIADSSAASDLLKKSRELTVTGKKRVDDDSDSMSAPNNISTKIMPAVPVAVASNQPKKGIFYNALKPLKDHGITFHLLLIDNFVSNVVGVFAPVQGCKTLWGLLKPNSIWKS